MANQARISTTVRKHVRHEQRCYSAGRPWENTSGRESSNRNKMDFDIIVNGKNYSKDKEKHEFSIPNSAKSAQLTSCTFQTMPDGLLEHKGISNLLMRKCKFLNGSVPSSITALKNLQQLTLSECGFREFPTEVAKINTLNKLVLSNNRKCSNQLKNSFTTVPQCLGQLKHLKYLDLSWCRLEKCPHVISKLEQLETLNLHGNFYIENLAPLELEKLTKLEHLNLNYCGLSHCPDFPVEMKKLRYLNMGVNDIKFVSNSMANLTNLQHLDISICELTSFPEAVTTITSLVHLNLSGNNLKQLSASIIRLKKLEHFDVSRCNLTELPEYIADLKSLVHLDVSDNELSSLPVSLVALTSLRELRVVNCGLEAYPSVCEKISEYARIDFTDNPIMALLWGVATVSVCVVSKIIVYIVQVHL